MKKKFKGLLFTCGAIAFACLGTVTFVFLAAFFASSIMLAILSELRVQLKTRLN